MFSGEIRGQFCHICKINKWNMNYILSNVTISSQFMLTPIIYDKIIIIKWLFTYFYGGINLWKKRNKDFL